jgi:Asp-tRNA(Asn)/Glu-tRNA(Gln) amidotransferase A subunit family amidase
MDVSWMTAADLQAALRGRELSAVEVLDAVIRRSEAVNPKINALALPLFERAREAAQRADQALARGEGGPLCGIPVTIKDSQWLAGFPCKNGSKTLEGFVPRKTCAAIERLEAAGAVIFAKTTCPEFSYLGVTFSEAYGTTANPWDLTRTPGGSSGGAGAALSWASSRVSAWSRGSPAFRPGRRWSPTGRWRATWPMRG